MLKRIALMSSILALAACSHSTEVSQETLTPALKSYLQQKGSLCLTRYTWPIHVPQQAFASGSRDAVQMPVLEKEGLVKSSAEQVQLERGDTGQVMPSMAVRYDLTDAGRQYFQNRDIVTVAADGSKHVHKGDFCVATLTLDKITGWTPPTAANGKQITTVSYTYNIEAAPWLAKPEVQQVFPMITRVVQGAHTMELKEAFALTDKGWQAQDIN